MGRLVRTGAAEEDLLGIWLYIAKHNERAAERLFREFDSVFDLLSDTPGMGMARPELSAAVRSFPVRSYMVFYRPISDGVEILRVVHGARDLSSLSFAPDPD